MEEITRTFEARLLMEPYIIENYSKYIDMDKLLDLEEQTKKILSSDILEQKDAVIFCNIDDALHRTIADACKNKYLNMNLSQIYDQNIRIRILGEQNIWERHKVAAMEHLELINYIKNHDLPSALNLKRMNLRLLLEAAVASFLS